MMRITRKVLSMVLCLMLVGISAFPASALEKEDGKSLLLREFYEDRTGFAVFDKQGNDITDKFYEETKAFHQSKQFLSVDEYIKQNVSRIRHEEYEAPTRRGQDLAKTVTEMISKTLYSKGNPNVTQEVHIIVRQTIYYDPNTYQITQYSNPILREVICGSLSYSNVSLSASKINAYTVKVSVSIKFSLTDVEEGVPIYIDYGYFTGSFTVSP